VQSAYCSRFPKISFSIFDWGPESCFTKNGWNEHFQVENLYKKRFFSLWLWGSQLYCFFLFSADVLNRCNLLIAVASKNSYPSSCFGNFRWTIIFNNGFWGTDCNKQTAPIDDIWEVWQVTSRYSQMQYFIKISKLYKLVVPRAFFQSGEICTIWRCNKRGIFCLLVVADYTSLVRIFVCPLSL